jgi:hypothetical protein
MYSDKTHPLAAAIIVGEHADVPAYTSNTISGVTDHYYRCLDTEDYDADAGTPDIAVGRFAVDTEEQLAIVVDKQLRYEAGVFKDDSWLKKVSFIATDDASHWQIAEGSFNYLVNLYTGPQGFVGNFPKPETAGGDLLYAITNKVKDAEVIDRLREGRGFINYGGHGGSDYWVSPRLEKKDVESLKNTDVIPLVMANACNTGDFRVLSMGQIWQRATAGAVIYYGSMDSTYWNEDDVLQRRMYDGIYRDGRRTWAAVTDFAQKELWRHYGGAGSSKYYYETYETFGDPLTRFRTAPPVTVAVQGAATAQVGTRQIAYQVTDKTGKPIAGARVALWKQSPAYTIAGETDRDGKILFALSEGYDSAGTFDVTVSGDNLKLWQGKLEIVSPVVAR